MAEEVHVPAAARPTYHIVAPRGWMNDPCAPGYNAETETYHLMYQWNPYSCKWDNISWGAMTSKDLVSWKHVSLDKPVLTPDKVYDCKGIFTGSMLPPGLDRSTQSSSTSSSTMTLFYTSVTQLPIHWTQQHQPGSEGLSIATSSDDGQSWQKDIRNPILVAEPDHLDVTGFRDPFVSPSPPLDAATQSQSHGHGHGQTQSAPMSSSSSSSSSRLYGVLSGGERGRGPRLFLYLILSSDLTRWEFITTLFRHVPGNYMPSNKWAGDFGTNWECTNFFQLSHAKSGEQRTVWVMGSEGSRPRPWMVERSRAAAAAAAVTDNRASRYLHWFFGRPHVSAADSKFDVGIDTPGLLDWGDLYAANTFQTPDGRRIAWGWLVEREQDGGNQEAGQEREDRTGRGKKKKEWIGCLGIPRELLLNVHDRVVGTLVTAPNDIASFDVTANQDGSSCRVVTLGIRPLGELDRLRTKRLYAARGLSSPSLKILSSAPKSYTLSLTVTLTSSCKSAGLVLCRPHPSRHSTNHPPPSTSILFYQDKELLVIADHNHQGGSSSGGGGLATRDQVVASHTLLKTLSELGEVHHEPLSLRVFVDHDIVEVFANDRCAIATTLVHADADTDTDTDTPGDTPSESSTVSWVCDGHATIESVQVWEMASIGLGTGPGGPG